MASTDTPVVTTPAEGQVRMVVGALTINGLVTQPFGAGDAGPAVASFRNLQYARFAARWHEAALVDLAATVGVWDATRWGPRPPQTLDVVHGETAHLYPRMSLYDRVSEFDCLNLNVYTPLATLEGAAGAAAADARVPVLVWIHGGSFEWGDGGCEFDGQFLASRSVQTGRPVVVVSVSYRLGTLGFFTSEELRAEARARGEVGYSNLGLHDQRLALEWVQRNIHLFGGDPARVTLAGESAGAIAVLAHLRGNAPGLAQNALLMSPGTVDPVPFAAAQPGFDAAVAALGLPPDAPAADKLAALRRAPYEQLYALGAGRIETILCEDPHFFAPGADADAAARCGSRRLEDLDAVPAWIEHVVVGKTREETAHTHDLWTQFAPGPLLAVWAGVYGDAAYGEAVLRHYGVDPTKTETPSRAAVARALVACTSHALIDAAVEAVATTHLQQPGDGDGDRDRGVGKVHLYRVDQEDLLAPAGSPFAGRAYHSLDNAYLFCFPSVAGAAAPPAMRAAAEAFSGAALALAYNEVSWPALRGGGATGTGPGPDDRQAVFSAAGLTLDAVPPSPPWAPLATSYAQRELFFRTKELLWKGPGLAPEPEGGAEGKAGEA